MSAWTDEQLERIGRTGEVQIAARRSDGSLRSFTTIWIVRVGGDLVVRSWNGPDGSWFRGATSSGAGAIRVGDGELDVQFRPADDFERSVVDAAYRSKYGNSRYADAMIADGPAATTLRVMPS